MSNTTGDNRTWTARDERELRAEHKRVTRATIKHLGTPPTEQDRTLFDKLLRRRTAETDLPLNKRPLPPKAQGDSHWWSRSSTESTRRDHTVEQKPDVRRAMTVTANTRLPPPIPPRYDLMQTALPERSRRKSEHDSAARQRARQNALKHLETERGVHRYAVEKKDYVPPTLEPGTWIPGQLNAVPVESSYPDEYEQLATPQLYDRFPLPPTQPLNIVGARQRIQDIRNIPIPPVPPMPDRSNRESFIELRRKRSYRV